MKLHVPGISSSADVAPRSGPKPEPLPLPRDLDLRLRALRQRHRMVSIGTGVGILVGATCALALVQAFSDWWLDLPWFARAGFLLVDLTLLAWFYRRQLDRPLRTRLTLGQTALMVGKRWPESRQSIITAVELSEGTHRSTRGSPQLAAAMLEEARKRAKGLDFLEVVPLLALKRALMLGAGGLLLAGGIAAAAWPASLSLLERLFLLNVPLPTKTIVVPATRDLTVSVGTDVEMITGAQGVIPPNGRITITYPQSSPQEYSVSVTSEKTPTYSFTLHNVQTAFKYRFHLNDGDGPEFTVAAKRPPSVSSVECEQVFPAYTGLAARKLAPTELSLLAGSHLQLRVVVDEPLQSATVVLKGGAPAITGTVDATGLRVEADVQIPTKDLTGFSLHLVDRDGMESINETVYTITLVPDRAPVVKVVRPADASETVTLVARPVIAFAASDDFGLTQLTLDYEVVPPAATGESAATPGETQHVVLKVKPQKSGDDDYEYVLAISAQRPALQVGDTINYWIEAIDNNMVTGPGVTKTGKRQLIIVSPAAKEAEIVERIQQRASEIDSLSTTQEKISTETGNSVPAK